MQTDKRPADDDAFSAEETERRARDAIRRSFQTPYKPQKQMVGKTGRPSPRDLSSSSKAAKKAE